jgi:hypothetical protein
MIDAEAAYAACQVATAEKNGMVTALRPRNYPQLQDQAMVNRPEQAPFLS